MAYRWSKKWYNWIIKNISKKRVDINRQGNPYESVESKLWGLGALRRETFTRELNKIFKAAGIILNKRLITHSCWIGFAQRVGKEDPLGAKALLKYLLLQLLFI